MKYDVPKLRTFERVDCYCNTNGSGANTNTAGDAYTCKVGTDLNRLALQEACYAGPGNTAGMTKFWLKCTNGGSVVQDCNPVGGSPGDGKMFASACENGGGDV